VSPAPTRAPPLLDEWLDLRWQILESADVACVTNDRREQRLNLNRAEAREIWRSDNHSAYRLIAGPSQSDRNRSTVAGRVKYAPT